MTATDAPATHAAGTVLRHTARKDRPAPVTRTAPHRNAAGHDLGTVDLEPTVFGLEPNRAVLHQVVTAQLAAARAGTQSTKTRAEVRGGGAKPFRQKGTGRARQGSSRSPSMTGGGVALGPEAAQLRAAHPEEDGPPGPPVGAERPGRHRAASSSSTTGRSRRPRPRTPPPSCASSS